MTQIDSKTDLGLPSRFDCTDMMGMRTTKREIQIMDNICTFKSGPHPLEVQAAWDRHASE